MTSVIIILGINEYTIVEESDGFPTIEVLGIENSRLSEKI